jgi:N-acetylmuramoyl-L-alanine amidase
MQIASNRLFLDNNTPVKFFTSPNHGGPLQEKAFIIMHYTGGSSLQSAIGWLIDPASKVSSHLVIGRNGDLAQLVPFDTVGWHAGISAWENYTSLNNFSIGIELDNAGMMKRVGNQWISSFGKVYPDSEVIASAHKSTPSVVYGWHKYTDPQLKTAAEVVAALIKAYGFREILGHDDIAPKRKWDPGPAFPMEQFRLRHPPRRRHLLRQPTRPCTTKWKTSIQGNPPNISGARLSNRLCCCRSPMFPNSGPGPVRTAMTVAQPRQSCC